MPQIPLHMFKTLILISLTVVLAGCQSSPDKSSENKNQAQKKISTAQGDEGLFSSIRQKNAPRSISLPPDLISKANEKVKSNHDAAQQENADQRVLPEVPGTRLMSASDGKKWLQVETDAQTVWDTLVDFWALEQIDLVDFQPAAGIMETDWISTDRASRAKNNGVFATLFSRVIGKDVSFDKYKIRLEKESSDVTSIYVTHRSTVKRESNYQSQQRITQWQWVEGDSDTEKVAQLLQVMVLLFEGNAANAA